jgi:hypothetical protein
MRSIYPIPLALALALPAAPAAGQGAPDAPDASVEARPEPRPYKLGASAQFRSLVIRDEDPRNDELMIYSLKGTGMLTDKLSIGIRMGLSQRFVAEPDESGFRFQDTSVGLGYDTPVDLGHYKLDLHHSLSAYVPTSRASQEQDLYVAPQYSFDASIEVLKGLTVGLSPSIQYRFHKYAERAGIDGGMNTRVRYSIHAGVDYALLESPGLGNIGVGASAGTEYDQLYASRESYTSSESDQSVIQQNYDWEAHLQYAPFKNISVAAAIEHGGPVLRDGIVNTFFFHREETEMAFTLAGSY